MNGNSLAERSVLMRFTASLPGQHRQDKNVTAEVRASKGLGATGKWVKDLYPEFALKAVKTNQGEARAYHDKVTLPFGSRDETSDGPTALAGIGILPAALIMEYGDKMREFADKQSVLVERDFLSRGREIVDWAVVEHNGTFEPGNYPGCERDSSGNVLFNEVEWREKMSKKFRIRTEPLPVPNAQHFTDAVTSLLGIDAFSVNVRVQDAEVEAKRELVRRMVEPLRAMATKIAEQPKDGRSDVIFRDTLIDNVREIVQLAPKLNLSGDPAIDAFVAEMEGLTRYNPETLRKDKATRAGVAEKAADTLKRLSGYQL